MTDHHGTLRSARWRPGDAVVLALLGAAAAFLVAYLVPAQTRPVQLGADAGFTYGYLPSVLIEADLDFSDDARPFDSSMPHTATGYTHNAFPIGPAVWWSPAFVVGHGIAGAARVVTGGSQPALDGRSWPYDATVPTLAFVLGLLGVWATYGVARTATPPLPAALGAVGIWLAGPAVNVTHERILTSNAAGFAAAALFTLAWLRLRGRREDLVAVAGLGLLGGLLVLTRWQSALLLLGPAVDALRGSLRGRDGPDLRALLTLGLTAALAFVPQMLVWDTLYGSPLRPPRGEAAGAFLDLSGLHLSDLLFSWRHGAISWHPVLAIGVVGLVLHLRRQPLVAGALLAGTVVLALVNAGILDWWAGASFGQRRFDGVWPALALGVAVVAARVPRWLAIGVMAVLTVWNSVWHLAFVERIVSQIEAVTPADVLGAVGKLPPAGQLAAWSPRKLAWFAGVALVAALPLALRSGRGRRLRDRVGAWVGGRDLVAGATAAGLVLVVATTGAVAVAAREPGRYDAHVFEAGFFVPQFEPPVTTSRTVGPGEDVWTLIWAFPGFLPPGPYRAVVVGASASQGAAELTVHVDGRPVVRMTPDGEPGSAVGEPFELGSGFLRLGLEVRGAPVHLEAVRLEPVTSPGRPG
ncbi:MAG TPA: hypothetical protein VGA69_11710 [Nitriliruptorales bacterium]